GEEPTGIRGAQVARGKTGRRAHRETAGRAADQVSRADTRGSGKTHEPGPPHPWRAVHSGGHTAGSSRWRLFSRRCVEFCQPAAGRVEGVSLSSHSVLKIHGAGNAT